MVNISDKALNIVFNKGNTTAVLCCAISLTMCAYLIFAWVPLPEFNDYSNSHHPDYHPDEGVWTAAGKYYFEKFFLDKDYSYETWNVKRFGNFGDRNPVLVKYLVGSSLFLSGEVRKGEDIPGFGFDRLDWEKVKNIKPPVEVLSAARVPIRIMGIVTVILFFFLIRTFTGSLLLGWTGALFLGLQPLVISFSQKVMNDMPALCFSLLALLTASYSLHAIWDRTIKHTVLSATLIGLTVGLALQTKLSTLLIFATIVIWGLIELLRTFGITKWSTISKPMIMAFLRENNIYKKFIAAIASFGLVVGLVWIAPNPLLYHNTLKNTYFILLLSKKVESNPSALPEQKNTHFQKRWSSFVANGPERSGVFSYYFNLPDAVDKAMILVGVLAYLLMLTSTRLKSNKNGLVNMGIWMFIITCGILLWTPFDWPRWYIPMSPVWAVMQSIGLIALMLVLFEGMKLWLKPSVKGSGS